jgi:hypothetical protein
VKKALANGITAKQVRTRTLISHHILILSRLSAISRRMRTRKCGKTYITSGPHRNVVLTAQFTESNHSCYSTRSNPPVGNGETPRERRRRCGPKLPNSLSAHSRFLWTGYLYKDFSSVGDYEVVLKYAQDLGVVRWSNGAKRMFFADGSGRTAIRQFIERRVTGGT